MDTEEVSVSLPKDLADMVRREVGSGAFASDAALIRDALELWQDRQQRLDEIRRSLRDAASDTETITAEAMRDHFEERLASIEGRRAP